MNQAKEVQAMISNLANLSPLHLLDAALKEHYKERLETAIRNSYEDFKNIWNHF